MAKFKEKMRAEELRREGWSFRDIAKELYVSKASVGIWCRDIELTTEQKDRLYQKYVEGGKRGILVAAENRKRRTDAYVALCKEDARKILGRLSGRELLLTGIALYWAEGSKGGKFSFVNSDPKMVLLMFYWLQQSMQVRSEDVVVTVSINEIHRGRIDLVEHYWRKLLGLKRDQFRKPSFIKTLVKKVYKNHETYYGIVSLRVKKSRNMHRKILAYISYLQEYDYAPM